MTKAQIKAREHLFSVVKEQNHFMTETMVADKQIKTGLCVRGCGGGNALGFIAVIYFMCFDTVTHLFRFRSV